MIVLEKKEQFCISTRTNRIANVAGSNFLETVSFSFVLNFKFRGVAFGH